MIFQQQTMEKSHPADSLGLALTRASGVLSALTACHDARAGGFAVADQFVLQAVIAIEGFMTDARNAYLELCNSCDVGVTGSVQEAPEMPIEESVVLPPLPVEARKHVAPQGEFAPDYDALMRKLTAAEVFAAERDGPGNAESPSALLPLLKGLRSDLERLRAA
jgi:hypothetical protein